MLQAALVIIEGPVNSSSIISKTSTTSCWACKSKEWPSLKKTSFRDSRKKDGSIGDLVECKWNIIFLTEEYTDCLFNDKIILPSQERFKSDHHEVYTEVNKIVLNSKDKRFETLETVITYP